MKSSQFIVAAIALVGCLQVPLGKAMPADPDSPSCDPEWQEWSDCDKECGGGFQTRTRAVCQVSNRPVSTVETRSCNTQLCDVDCQLGEWEEWNQCSKTCGGGHQGRTRSILVEPVADGAVCGPQVETQDCNTVVCDVDCVLGEWSEWTECDKQCDTGMQKRSRSVEVPQSGNGAVCE